MAITLRLSTNTVNGKKSLGGAIDTTDKGIYSVTNSTTNYLFDEITKNENIAGTVDYRTLYLKNDSTSSDVFNIEILFNSLPSTDKIQIGFLSDKNVQADAIPDENTPPSTIEFIDIDKTTSYKLIKGQNNVLKAGEYVGFWLKRTPQNTASSGQVTSELIFEINVQD